VERYDQEWQGPAEALTTAVVTDGSGQLALADISDQAWVTEKAGVRINHVLDACQWPTALRRIDTGLVTVVAANAGDLTSGALAHLTDVADADLGYFFISDDGYATFHDQNHRNANGVEALATFGDIGGTLPYEDLKVAFGIDQVLNDVTIGPGPNTAIDIDSIRRFRDRSLTRSTVADGALSTSQAALLVSRYKDARQRIDELVLTPSAFDTEANAMWLQVLTVNVGDRIAIIKTPAGVEPPVVQECYVEAILDEFAGDLQWTQTLELSPASAPRALTGLAGLGVTPDSSLALIQQPRFPIQIPTIV
jgi:hypothetical protein